MSQHFGLVVYQYIYRVALVGIKGQFHTRGFVFERELFLGGEVDALCFLFDEPDLGKLQYIFAGTAVKDRHFWTAKVHLRIVYPHGPERRHQMFEGADACLALYDGGAPRGVEHVLGEGVYHGRSFEVVAYEDNPSIHGCRTHLCFGEHPRMESLPCHAQGCCKCLLF